MVFYHYGSERDRFAIEEAGFHAARTDIVYPLETVTDRKTIRMVYPKAC
jgi:hypothetical protein